MVAAVRDYTGEPVSEAQIAQEKGNPSDLEAITRSVLGGTAEKRRRFILSVIDPGARRTKLFGSETPELALMGA
jgi:hypothetical protein